MYKNTIYIENLGATPKNSCVFSILPNHMNFELCYFAYDLPTPITVLTFSDSSKAKSYRKSSKIFVDSVISSIGISKIWKSSLVRRVTVVRYIY